MLGFDVDAELKRVPIEPSLNDSSQIVVGRGTVGLGSYAPVVDQIARDTSLRLFLERSERRREQRDTPLPRATWMERRSFCAQLEEKNDRNQRDIKKQREQFHELREQQIAALQERRRLAKESKEAVEEELRREREHAKMERKEKEKVEQRIYQEEMKQQAEQRAKKLEFLKWSSKMAHQKAIEAVSTLRQRQRSEAKEASEKIKEKLNLRKKQDVLELQCNRSAILDERNSHAEQMASNEEQQQEIHEMNRHFVANASPNRGDILEARTIQLRQTKEAAAKAKKRRDRRRRHSSML